MFNSASLKQAAIAVERAVAANESAPILWENDSDDGYAVGDDTSRWIERMEREHV